MTSCATKKHVHDPSAPAQILAPGPVTLKIISPQPEEVLTESTVKIQFDLKNFTER
jgi:hypothetical protein